MRLTPVLFLTLMLWAFSGLAQRRNVTVMDDSKMLSYTITRYSPAWEVQSGNTRDQSPRLAEQSKLFKKIDDSNMHNLKNLLFAKGFVPREVEGMSSSTMESYLAGNRLVMHYRIRYKDHTIFLAHLNNSRSQSVIPFLIEKDRWVLDPGFADSDFFKLISKPYFNAYTGSFDGNAICDLGFEEIESDSRIYDYSGRNHEAQIDHALIVNGRIGGAIKLGPETDLLINLSTEKDLAGTRFSVDFHVNVQDNMFNKERKRKIVSAERDGKEMLLIFIENGFIHLKAEGAKTISVPYHADTWFHLTVKQSGKKLSMEIDGEEVGANTINSKDVLSGTVVRMGGRYSFKGILDEFRISK